LLSRVQRAGQVSNNSSCHLKLLANGAAASNGVALPSNLQQSFQDLAGFKDFVEKNIGLKNN
jgi:hypothetical protein